LAGEFLMISGKKGDKSVYFGYVLLYLCLQMWNVGFYYFFYQIITNGVVSMN